MNKITSQMIYLWNMSNMDWMGYELNKKNYPTYHHIQKRCHGGGKTIENGAILGTNNHKYLHIVEDRDLDMYVYLSIILKQINEQGYMPIERQKRAIDSILKQFEREHCSDTNAKGYPLIKEEYTRRLIKH